MKHMKELLLQIMAQAINLEAGHVIDGLLAVLGFFAVMQLKDIKTTLKDLRDLYLDHDRRITRMEAKSENQ